MLENLGVSQFSTLRWSFFQDVRRYASLGFNRIGVWRGKLEEIGADEAADFIFEMKMGVSSLSWAGGFTGGDGDSFASKIDDAIDAIQTAARLRANCLIVHPGSMNGHIRRHAKRLLDDALKILVPVAIDYGVRLALEPMDRKDTPHWTMLDGLAETVGACEMYSPEQVGLVWDLYHLGLNPTAWKSMPELLDRIAIVQLADRRTESSVPRRSQLGSGAVPLSNWLDRIQQLGYRGQWELEIAGSELGAVGYPDALIDARTYLLKCSRTLWSNTSASS